MARLGEACGGRTETFSGLAGMGDLMVSDQLEAYRGELTGYREGWLPEA